MSTDDPRASGADGVGKLCVFCGRVPAVRTKEHVLPVWLLEMSGGKNRPGVFADWDVSRTYAMDGFTARACDDCNGRWSQLEHRVMPVVAALTRGEGLLDESAAEDLLDWFDKVRIGCWLRSLASGKNPLAIEPLYGVDARTGLHDRLLYLARASRPLVGLHFEYIAHPIFQIFPTVFRLLVNGVAFVSASTIGIAAGPLGLPRVRMVRRLQGGRMECAVDESASTRTNWPAAPRRWGIVAQAIWSGVALDPATVARHARRDPRRREILAASRPPCRRVDDISRPGTPPAGSGPRRTGRLDAPSGDQASSGDDGRRRVARNACRPRDMETGEANGRVRGTFDPRASAALARGLTQRNDPAAARGRTGSKELGT